MEIDAEAELKGPHRGDLTCTLGLGCNVKIEGYGVERRNQLVSGESRRAIQVSTAIRYSSI